MDNGKVFFSKNGTFQNSGVPTSGANPAFSSLSGTFAFAVGSSLANADAYTLNAGQRSFNTAAPAGFLSLNTANLPTPTIADGSKYFDAQVYSGSSGTKTITTTFAPGLVWIKNRGQARWHCLFDVVRGPFKRIFSNATNAETNDVNYNLNSFTGTGYTLLDTDRDTNSSNGDSYISWAWDGGTSTVTNNNGSIASQVRAQPSAGFSICTYTGNGSGGATFGHGLNAGLGMCIIACRNTTNYWDTWHSGYYVAGSKNYIRLQSTGAAGYASDMFGTPTSSVMTLGSSGSMNGSGNTYVAYCFAPVAGYSAMGKYTGNGSADGVFVHTGFKVAWLLTKRTDGGSNNWQLIDSTRSPFNVADDVLKPDESAAESSHADYSVDFLSNGFKHRTGHVARNGSGNTYIYAAFAENPFQANGGLAR